MERRQSLESNADAGSVGGDRFDFRRSTFHGPVVGKLVENNHYARPSPASWPHQVGTVPPRAAGFQDRAEVARLAAALGRDNAGPVVQAAPAGVVVGLGGVGKTQLAADYARTAWQAGDLDVLVWITATTAAGIITGYAQAAAELLGADPADPSRAATAFLAWLEPKAGQRPCRWLVVVDDVADPADLTGLWPPLSPTGRTLVTTRRQEAALTTGRHLILVGVFTPAESLAYLTNALRPVTAPAGQLAALAHDLGHLPLALSQAAAYLTDTGTPAADYRQLLADRTTALRDAAPAALPDGQARAVAATWSLSIAHADRLRPAGLARPLLQLAAFLDANGIPEPVLTSLPARTYLAHHRTRLDAPGPSAGAPAHHEVAERDARTALSALRRLSLIEHTPTTPQTAVRVHQLVQRAVRDTLTPDQRDQTARTAADALRAAWPEIERDTALAQALRANTNALTHHAEDALYRPHAHAVLYRLGESLGYSGQVDNATTHFQHLVNRTNRHLGPNHPDNLVARRDLAWWQLAAGDAGGAVAAYTELLADQLRVLGADHPDTLSTRHGFAYCRGVAGDADGAADAYAQLLPDRARVLGENHRDTLTTRRQLAHWRGEAGDAAGAVAAHAELLADQLRVLGADHRSTLTNRLNLARWREEAGDGAGAAAAYADLLPDLVRILGEDHQYTLHTRYQLAWRQGESGNAAGAAAAYADLLQDLVRVLGEDHPDTLAARHQLAEWQETLGESAVDQSTDP
ncbi:tetratricopeptide repeat protein [Streptomyces sp. R21]|uniref:Tetratricopeptide repeat protein n=1 Tax=Streptomyces sp. R21 TaxID=3238627 RepID=A0AB39PL22_9ACTN